MKWKEEDHPRGEGGKFVKKFSSFSKPSNNTATKSNGHKSKLHLDDRITQRDYDEIFTPVMQKVSGVRKVLNKEGLVITVVYTWSHRYVVEVRNEEGYPYTILDKVRI